ncbi:BRCT domain-containing protein [Tenacibaculum piscium]|uniref:BRCT domain-containing protein n=1 Tax=Tenacibaculum piscium TaxID=1458515 RepID=UPI001F27058C|nr:BRCT domain-containing protein [Tenacibaculum piscium]
MKEKEIENLEDLFFIKELEPNFWMEYMSVDSFKIMLNVNDEVFNHHVKQTGNRCSEYGLKTTLTRNLSFEGSEISYLSVTAIYLILIHRFEKLEEEIAFFKERSFNSLLKYQGFKLRTKKKRKNPNYDFEKQGEYASKVIDKELKSTDLEIEDKGHLFYDKKILITGTFQNYQNRNSMADLIKNVGGHNRGMSKSLDFAIVGENAGPSKMQKIEDYGIKILNENDFIELFT